MIVYVDVLIFLNIFVDYFLIKISGILIKKQAKTYRMVIASIIGSLFSLYIFLPQQKIYFEIPVKFVMALIICFIAFGFKTKKSFLRTAFIFFSVTYLYGGIMLAVSLISKTNKMAVNNSVVYFNISPVVLIASSVCYYLSVMIFRYFFKKNHSEAEECKISVSLDGKSKTLNGIIDTGNSLSDVFGLSEIIIVNKKTTDCLVELREQNKRFRAVPCKTVSGTTLLDAYRFDEATVYYENQTKELKNPILAVSKVPLDSEIEAIINPRSLL